MSYQVLARKWRPQMFQEMVGQEHVLKALANALDQDRLHHAYLFTGTRGVGKTTVARIFSKSLNCEQGVGSQPCGQCDVCTDIAAGRFVDLIEIDAASRTKVEDMRELLDNVQYAPSRGRFKVYLIDEVHMLSNSSFNALLKTLEEPPPHVKFLLATTDPQKLPVTILSRCLQFSLKNLSPERIVKHLQHVLGHESVEFEESALWELARAADGSMRDALSLTDQAIAFGDGRIFSNDVVAMLGTIERHVVNDLLQLVVQGEMASVLEKVRHLSEFAPDYAYILQAMAELLHRIAIEQAVPGAIDNSFGDQAQVESLAHQVTPENVQLFYQIAVLNRKELALAPEPRVGFEMALLRMLSFKPNIRSGNEMRSRPATSTGDNAPEPGSSDPEPEPSSAQTSSHSPQAKTDSENTAASTSESQEAEAGDDASDPGGSAHQASRSTATQPGDTQPNDSELATSITALATSQSGIAPVQSDVAPVRSVPEAEKSGKSPTSGEQKEPQTASIDPDRQGSHDGSENVAGRRQDAQTLQATNTSQEFDSSGLPRRPSTPPALSPDEDFIAEGADLYPVMESVDFSNLSANREGEVSFGVAAPQNQSNTGQVCNRPDIQRTGNTKQGRVATPAQTEHTQPAHSDPAYHFQPPSAADEGGDTRSASSSTQAVDQVSTTETASAVSEVGASTPHHQHENGRIIRSNEAGQPESASNASEDLSLTHPGEPRVNGMRWPDVVTRLALTGMTQSLVQRCVLQNVLGTRFEFRIDESHIDFFDQPQQQRLKVALEAFVGEPVTVDIAAGESEWLSPLQELEQKRAEMLAQAISEMTTDANIKALQERFDATLVESSIEPIIREK